MFAFTHGKTVQKRYGNGTESNGRYGMQYDSCVRLDQLLNRCTTVVRKRNGNFFCPLLYSGENVQILCLLGMTDIVTMDLLGAMMKDVATETPTILIVVILNEEAQKVIVIGTDEETKCRQVGVGVCVCVCGVGGGGGGRGG